MIDTVPAFVCTTMYINFAHSKNYTYQIKARSLDDTDN